MLLIVPAFVPASAPTNWEFRALTATSVRLRLRTTPVLPMLLNNPTFGVVESTNLQIAYCVALSFENGVEGAEWREVRNRACIDVPAESVRVRSGNVGVDALQVAGIVH